jgi:hypothetical protein
VIAATAAALALAAMIAVGWSSAPATGPAGQGKPATLASGARAGDAWPATVAAAPGAPAAMPQALVVQRMARASESRALRAREIAWRMLPRFGWRPRFQFRYLKWLWDRESSWNVYASNPYSGAYGIPQAVPGWKMASAGRNWRTSPWVQIRWGLRYIRSRYGSPRAAWDNEVAYGWY